MVINHHKAAITRMMFTCIRFFMPVLSTRLRLLTGASSLRDFSTKPEKCSSTFFSSPEVFCASIRIQKAPLVRTVQRFYSPLTDQNLTRMIYSHLGQIQYVNLWFCFHQKSSPCYNSFVHILQYSNRIPVQELWTIYKPKNECKICFEKGSISVWSYWMISSSRSSLFSSWSPPRTSAESPLALPLDRAFGVSSTPGWKDDQCYHFIIKDDE